MVFCINLHNLIFWKNEQYILKFLSFFKNNEKLYIDCYLHVHAVLIQK